MLACQKKFSLSGLGRQRAHLPIALVITIFAQLLSCNATPPLVQEPVQIAARWRFADARTCDNSGVVVVAISGEGLEPAISLCTQGEQSAFVFGSLPPGTHKVFFEGRSSGAMPIYRAEVVFTLEANQPKEIDVPMIFEGGP